MKKEKSSPHDKQVVEQMHEFKKGDLHSGKSQTIVTNPK